MLTKIEVTKTYWVGVGAEQKEDLLAGVLTGIEQDRKFVQGGGTTLTSAQYEALNDLRLALLNA